MSFITSVIALLLQWYVWGPLVIVLLYLTWRNYRSIDVIKNVESVLLTLEIPKTNDKSELAAEQMFASLHGILRDARELKANNGYQEHLSFEIASVGDEFNSTFGRRNRCKASSKARFTPNTRKYKSIRPKKIMSLTNATTA